MATNADGPHALVDTSVAVALVVSDHSAHDVVMDHLGRRVLGLSGHAAFETYSVLTRLPGPNRLSAAEATRAILANFPGTRHLSPATASELTHSLANHGVAGGAVYDALVAATAHEHNLTLVTRGQKALDTYRAIGVELEVIT